MCDEIERLDKAIRIINGARFYEMPLSFHYKVSATKTLPVALKVNGKVIKGENWNDFFYNSVYYLVTFCKCNYRYYVFNNILLDKKPLFIKCEHVGYKKLKGNIYLKCDSDENSLYHLLIEIIGYFEMKSEPHLLVYRYPVSENRYVKDYIIRKNKNHYNLFLKEKYPPLFVIEIERKTEVVNEVFARFSPYYDLYLFDDYDIFIHGMRMFFESIDGLYSKEHLLLLRENVVKYLVPYYKQIHLYTL